MGFIFDPSLVLYLPLYDLDGGSFMSKDAYGHLCPVTGALWTPQGRYFDGTDDEIRCGKHIALQATTDTTILVWANPTDGAYDCIVHKTNKAGTDRYTLWAIGRTFKECQNDGGYYVGDSTAPTGVWTLFGLTFGSTGFRMSLNGVAHGVDATNTSVMTTGTYQELMIGEDMTGSYDFKGLMGEVWIFSRILSLVEIQGIYLATKWRYR